MEAKTLYTFGQAYIWFYTWLPITDLQLFWFARQRRRSQVYSLFVKDQQLCDISLRKLPV